jgi:hypothetical protein
MSTLAPSVRERVYKAIADGWTTERIAKRFDLSPSSVAAFRANHSMGRWTPAKSTRPAARKSTRGRRTVTNRMQFSVPKSNLNVSYKGNTANITISL